MTEHDDRTIGATAPDASIRFSFSLSLSIYIYTGLVVDGRGSFAAYKEIQRRDRSIRGVGLCLLSRPQKNCYKQRKKERERYYDFRLSIHSRSDYISPRLASFAPSNGAEISVCLEKKKKLFWIRHRLVNFASSWSSVQLLLDAFCLFSWTPHRTRNNRNDDSDDMAAPNKKLAPAGQDSLSFSFRKRKRRRRCSTKWRFLLYI